jgi:hypothetical protein
MNDIDAFGLPDIDGPLSSKKICEIRIAHEGNLFIAFVTHTISPKGDNRVEPTTEFKNPKLEDLFTEVKKYLEDCYDED